MVRIVMKMKFLKNAPKVIHYRQYKKIDKKKSREELKQELNRSINCYGSFKSIFLEVLNKHVPLKKKHIRANHVPYMTKALMKAKMRWSQLKSKSRNCYHQVLKSSNILAIKDNFYI